MEKRGSQPKGKVRIEWSSDFAYAIGLIATDGSLSKDRRHISFVSKDIDQIRNYMESLDLGDTKIGIVRNTKGQKSFRVQFSNPVFYHFLESIGLYNNKSLTMGKLDIPREYFFDFLRGCFDGDGCIYSYFDKRWKSSFMFYVSFTSASPVFIDWLRLVIHREIGISGYIKHVKNTSWYDLRYAKKESSVLLQSMYPNFSVRCLLRKKLKIMSILAMMNKSRENILTK